MAGCFRVIGCLVVIAVAVMRAAAAETNTVGDSLGWKVPSRGAIAHSTGLTSKLSRLETPWYSTGPVHKAWPEYPRINSTIAPQTSSLARPKPPAWLTSLLSPTSPTTTSAPSIPTALRARSWKSSLAATALHHLPLGPHQWFSWPWPSLS
ncbi:hypothetical protein RHSIM_Rhsim03G0249900 [Rhododendron simsii]|uniref:Uncharacterized protein n=1 Tax=Rhododendron simsii TaxID=118357 RepID=A0A834HA76_RHOSS|nr:hypothetical protein RHSIM_Rhsim03G0249900 [Rhododendron simsii]